MKEEEEEEEIYFSNINLSGNSFTPLSLLIIWTAIATAAGYIAKVCKVRVALY